MEFEIRYAVLDSNLIFNECGPMSAGPIGWSEHILKKKKEKAEKYIKTMNKKSGFYTKLEESILNDGVRNPILVRCGWCSEHKLMKLPIEMQKDTKKILMCDSHGGSRLWVAQNHNLKIPCLITDFIGRFSNEQLVEKDKTELLKLFKDKPRRISVNSHGVSIHDLPQIHMESK